MEDRRRILSEGGCIKKPPRPTIGNRAASAGDCIKKIMLKASPVKRLVDITTLVDGASIPK